MNIKVFVNLVVEFESLSLEQYHFSHSHLLILEFLFGRPVESCFGCTDLTTRLPRLAFWLVCMYIHVGGDAANTRKAFWPEGISRTGVSH